MKTIYQSKRLTIIVPSTRMEIVSLLLFLGAVVAAIKGDTNTAWHLIEIGMLSLIAEKLEK